MVSKTCTIISNVVHTFCLKNKCKSVCTCIISTNVTSLSSGSYALPLPPGTVTSGNAGANTTTASATLVVN